MNGLKIHTDWFIPQDYKSYGLERFEDATKRRGK
jgi:hypothetical protein